MIFIVSLAKGALYPYGTSMRSVKSESSLSAILSNFDNNLAQGGEYDALWQSKPDNLMIIFHTRPLWFTMMDEV
ncbi:MAG TPA: hypothetical protein VGE85_05430 [Terracidiphilus sp.]|jgi:hypothetical protein